MKVIIATKNEGKVREFRQLLAPFGYEPISMAEANVNAEIVEDGETFEENAHIKAKAVHKLTGMPVIADDSGLEVEFLGGAPGPHAPQGRKICLRHLLYRRKRERILCNRNA